MFTNSRTLSRLLVRGPFRGPSGYDRHVRAFTRELVRQGVAVQLVDVPEWSSATLPEGTLDPFFDSLVDPVDAQVALHFTMPHQVTPFDGYRNVNFTMFEATRVPYAWIDANRTHDLLIVPTESSRRAWIASGMPPDRIALCPLGIDPDDFGGNPKPLDFGDESGFLERRVRFLNVSELGPRKNTRGLIRAWMRATDASDDAVLMLKLGNYAAGWLELLKKQIAEDEERLGLSLDAAAPVAWIEDVLPDWAMPQLFATATHYISLSHGEGWDQTMMEAAASGLRLIAPDHSAYQAYLDSTVATMIPSREVPATFDGDPSLQELFVGASWWKPDEDAAAAAIRRAIDGQDDPNVRARERVLTQFTWSAATRRLIEILSGLEPPRRRTLFGRLLGRSD